MEGFDIAHSEDGAGALVFHINGSGNGSLSRISLINKILRDSSNNGIHIQDYLPCSALVQILKTHPNGKQAATLDQGLRKSGNHTLTWKTKPGKQLAECLFICLLRGNNGTAGEIKFLRKF